MDKVRDSNADESRQEKKPSFLNIHLLPIKCHYFLAYGALGGVISFLPILIKVLGINAISVGVIYTILPFTVLFMKPAIGALTDHFKNIRCMIIIVVLIMVASQSFILLIPPIHSNSNDAIFGCGNNYTLLSLPVVYNSSCVDHHGTKIIICEAEFNMCAQSEEELGAEKDNSGLTCDGKRKKTHLNFTINTSHNDKFLHNNENTAILSFGMLNANHSSSLSPICEKLINISTLITCSNSEDGCILSPHEDNANSVYSTHQFWIVLLLVVLGGIGYSAMFTLSDAACYEILKDKPEDYGKQRLWATISYGSIAFLTGYLNDLKSASSLSPDYSPGFMILIALGLLDIAILFSLVKMKISAFSYNIFKDIGRLFVSWQVIIFSVGVFIIGAFHGLLWTYQFWFLQNLGANQMLLGLTTFVQCLFEVPSFFFSGWIIQKLGHSLCLILTFVVFALRYFLYYILVNPWYVLFIEVLHGWGYGVFFAAMTSFAKHNASPGTEVTMQGVLGGLFEGLGVGIGSLLGGVGFEKLGGHNTFLSASIISFISILMFSSFTILSRSRNFSGI